MMTPTIRLICPFLLSLACTALPVTPRDAGTTDVGPATPIDSLPALALLAMPASLTVTEGDDQGTAFMVGLNHSFPTDVTISIASLDRTIATAMPETIVFRANQVVAQMVTVFGTSDDDLVDNTTSISLTAAEVPAASVRVQVTDVNVQALLVTASQSAIVEGKAGQIEVRLAFRPEPGETVEVMVSSAKPGKLDTKPSLLTFTAGSFSQPQSVTLSTSRDADVVDDMISVTVSGTGVPMSVVTPITIIDVDVLNLDINPTVTTISEGDTVPATVFVRLTAPPPDSVTVSVTSSDTARVKVTPEMLTFAPNNFNTDQELKVLAISDDDARDDVADIVLVAAGMTERKVRITIKDRDIQAIIASPPSVTVNEGDSMAFTVRLAYRPSRAVAVTVFGATSPKIDVKPSQLTFDSGDYSVSQRVVVTGLQDDDLLDEMVKITLVSPVASQIDVPISVKDDDK